MKTLLVILALLCAGCCSQRSQKPSNEQRRAEYLAILKTVYGDDSDFRLARAIESRIQRIELDQKLGR